MGLAVGALILIGLLLPLLGFASKFMGTPLLSPWIEQIPSYMILANFCLLFAMVIDKYNNNK